MTIASSKLTVNVTKLKWLRKLSDTNAYVRMYVSMYVRIHSNSRRIRNRPTNNIATEALCPTVGAGSAVGFLYLSPSVQ